MEVPWTNPRCILCLGAGALTEVHIIPQQIGGKLWARFLCKPCNDRLGDEVEARLKVDPAIQYAVRTFARQIPSLAKNVLEGQPYIGRGPGGMVRGRMKRGRFNVDSHQADDGSIHQPTPAARQTISRMIQRYSPPPRPNIADALKRFDEAPDNTLVDIAPGVAAIRWQD